MIDPQDFFSNFHWNASDMILELQRQGFVPAHFVEIIGILHPLHEVWLYLEDGDQMPKPNWHHEQIQKVVKLIGAFLVDTDLWDMFKHPTETGVWSHEPEMYLQILMLALGFDEPPPVIRPITGVDAVITRFEYNGKNPETKLTDATKRAVIAAARRLDWSADMLGRRYKGMAGDQLTCYFHGFSYYKHKWHVAFSIYNWSEAKRSPGSSPHMVESGQINNITSRETTDAKQYRDLIADWGDHR